MPWLEQKLSTVSCEDLVDSKVPLLGLQYGDPLTSPERNPEKFKDVNLSVARAVHFAYGIGHLPPVVFPNASHLQHHGFTREFWEKYQNPESEFARINLMLDEYSKVRAFPVTFAPEIEKFSEEMDVLIFWSSITDEVQRLAKGVFLKTFISMWDQATPAYASSATEVNMVSPFYYPTEPKITSLQKTIWEKALKQIAEELSDGDFQNLKTFLDLYTHMKDPITGLPVTDEQINIFKLLYRKSIESINSESRSTEEDSVLIAQLALESSMQASLGYKDIFEVRLAGQHELQYVLIKDIFSLPKGELSDEKNLLERIEEIILDFNTHDAALITPITVSFTYNPTEEVDPYMFVVDGFHRLLSLMALRFLYEHENLDYLTDENEILRFCDNNGLAVEWKRDLVNALAALAERKDLISTLRKFPDQVKNLIYGQIPALLSHEPNYFTISVRDSSETNVVLLQPFHQAIYHDIDTPGLAVPPKLQSHGRAEGNERKWVMPYLD